MTQQPEPADCSRCGAEIAPTLLACPSCHQLRYSKELRAIAAQAKSFTRDDPTAAMIEWRKALRLLPPSSRQYRTIAARIETLGRRVDNPSPAEATGTEATGAEAKRPKSATAKVVGGAVAVGGLLWKLKAVAAFLLTKGKLFLLGLTNAGTFFSMVLSLGIYWAAWGWKFALGLIISLYVHEMGHVFALRRYGIQASAPMFLPGIGAVVRLKEYPANRREDARVGMAGPVWGLGAAVVAWLVALATGWQSWLAIAKVGAWINLFNLLPLGPLDGGRAFRSLTRRQRWWAVAAIAGAWVWTRVGMLVLVLLAAVFQAMAGKAAEEKDQPGLAWYIAVLLALALLCGIEVPTLVD